MTLLTRNSMKREMGASSLTKSPYYSFVLFEGFTRDFR
jgi:hypothetical protein